MVKKRISIKKKNLCRCGNVKMETSKRCSACMKKHKGNGTRWWRN